MRVKVKELFSQLKSGLRDQNPTFVQLLGLCPTLATTTSVPNAMGMGLAATFVLTCSNGLISLLRKFIPKEVRIAGYIVIISGFVSMVQMIIKVYFPELDKSLGVYPSYCQLYYSCPCGSLRLKKSGFTVTYRRSGHGIGLPLLLLLSHL